MPKLLQPYDARLEVLLYSHGFSHKKTMSALHQEQVLSVHHWTDRLFSFTTTRDMGLRFSNGHFTMIGLMVNNKPLLRAYSIVSPNYEEHLEFLSIKVPDGPLTSRLQHIQVGDSIIVGRKPTGTLLIDYLLPAKNLYLFGTGTGLAPFLSIIRDPDTYEKFEHVVLVHGVQPPFQPGRNAQRSHGFCFHRGRSNKFPFQGVVTCMYQQTRSSQGEETGARFQHHINGRHQCQTGCPCK